MAWKVEVSGMDELMRKFDQLPGKAAKVAAEALYEGAGVAADTVSRAVQGIATEKFRYAAGGRTRKPSPEEKAIVTQSKHGISKFRNTGVSIQTSVGFQNSGYGKITWNHAKTNTRTKYKQQKNGTYRHASQGGGESAKPVPLIVNAINSGTSFMQKQPFLRKAFSQSKGKAVATIEAGIKARESELDIG